jgi:hypothetical protein
MIEEGGQIQAPPLKGTLYNPVSLHYLSIISMSAAAVIRPMGVLVLFKNTHSIQIIAIKCNYFFQ